MKTTTEGRGFQITCVGVALFVLGIGYPLFTGEVYTETDLGNFHLPMRFFYAEALERGFGFIWFPYEYTGFYLHGEGQASLYHPLNWLSYRFLPLSVAFNLEVLRNFLFPLIGTYWFMRRFEVRRDASLLAAALFTFGSFNALHFMHLNVLAIVAHLPFLGVAIDVAVRSPRRDHAAWATVAVGLLSASQLMFGHPQFVWMSLLAEGALAIWLVARFGGARRLPGLLVAQALALLLAAIQILPQWETLGTSHRATPEEGFAFTLALLPVNLLQLVSPFFFRARAVGDAEATEFAVYCGALVPVLLAWVLLRWRSLGRAQSAVATLLGFGFIALVMALGEYGPIYRLQAELPIVGLFRGPARYIMLFQLSFAIVAGLAFRDLAVKSEAQRLGEGPERVPHIGWLFLPLLVAILVFFLASPIAMSWVAPKFAAEVSGTVRLAVGPILIALFSGLVWWAARGSRVGLLLLAPLALVDLAVYDLPWIARKPPVDLEQFVMHRQVPKWWDRHRVHWGAPALTMRHVRLVNGYVAMVPKRRLRTDLYLLNGRPPGPDIIAALRVAGVAYAYGAPVPNPLPRVRMVSDVVRAHDLQQQLVAIDLARTAIVHASVALPVGEPGSALVLEDLPGWLVVETNGPSKQLLVVAESHHPGWMARIDQAPAEVVRVYGDFMGVVVPAGTHEVVMEFAPESLRDGARLGALGFGLLIPLWIGVRRYG